MTIPIEVQIVRELERIAAALETQLQKSKSHTICDQCGHSWERLLPTGVKPFCRRCGLETHQ